MKCVACDVILTDQEARRKDRYGHYEDMCTRCLQASFIPVNEDEDLDDDYEADSEDDVYQHHFD